MGGVAPPASCAQGRRSTRLSYTLVVTGPGAAPGSGPCVGRAAMLIAPTCRCCGEGRDPRAPSGRRMLPGARGSGAVRGSAAHGSRGGGEGWTVKDLHLQTQ